MGRGTGNRRLLGIGKKERVSPCLRTALEITVIGFVETVKAAASRHTPNGRPRKAVPTGLLLAECVLDIVEQVLRVF
jgi:hypothetical protein